MHLCRHGWDWQWAVNRWFCLIPSLLSKAVSWITTAKTIQRLYNSVNSFRFTCSKQSTFLLSLISPRHFKHSAKHLITSKPYCVELQLHISCAFWCYLTTGADYLFFRWGKLIQSVFHYTSGFFSSVFLIPGTHLRVQSKIKTDFDLPFSVNLLDANGA